MDDAGLGIQQELQVVDESKQRRPDSRVEVGIGRELEPRSGKREDGPRNPAHDIFRRAGDLQGRNMMAWISRLTADTVRSGGTVGETTRHLDNYSSRRTWIDSR